MRVCMISYSFYESDNRVRRYAECLASRGDSVDVISLARNDHEPFARIKGVNVYRIQKRLMNERGKLSYLIRLVKFFVHSTWSVSRLHLMDPYHVIHVHNVPDFEVFSAIIPKLTGAKVILDIHDILPEFYADKFNVGTESLVFKLLKLVEKASASFADYVIVSNHIWQNKLQNRSVPHGKCSVIMNYPDPAIFHQTPVKKDQEKFVLLYPGTINKHQGLDIAIRAFARIKDEIPEAEFQIIGEGTERPALEHLIREFGLEKRIRVSDRIPLDKVATEMAKADVGIVPKRDDGFGGEAFSTKTWEFMSVGVPVILARTKIDDFYFNERVVCFFDPGKEESLARAIIGLRKDKGARDAQVSRGFEYLRDKNWEVRKQEYFDILGYLVR